MEKIKRQKRLEYQRNWNRTIRVEKMKNDEYRTKLNESHTRYRKSEKGKVVQREKAIRMYLKYPEKFKARSKLNYAIRKGRVEKLPCIVCGNEKSQAHHEDYTKPFDVIWLCDIHHKYIEGKLKLNINI